MSNLRQAAQQAIQAMKFVANPNEFAAVVADLEQALAEPEQPVGINGLTEAETTASASVAGLVRKAEQKPVAWMDREGDVYKMLPSPFWCPPHTPLYAHPPTPRSHRRIREETRRADMSDRELLELAAKAAGIESSIGLLPKDGVSIIQPSGDKWNPLTDDADAFRLAVKLRIKFRYNEALKQVLAWVDGTDNCESRVSIEECRGDENACSRLAIVRTAAEIGRQMS